MIRSVAVILIALVMMGGLAVSAQADTISVSGTLTGISTLTTTGNPLVFHGNFTGSGFDTFGGPFTTTVTSTITFTSLSFTTYIQSGSFVDVFSQGTVFGTSSGNGTVTGGTTTQIDSSIITGGTGIFAGETGVATVTSTGSTTTSSVTGSYNGSITIPEPGSLVLLLAGIGLLPLMRKRLAQGHRQAT